MTPSQEKLGPTDSILLGVRCSVRCWAVVEGYNRFRISTGISNFLTGHRPLVESA